MRSQDGGLKCNRVQTALFGECNDYSSLVLDSNSKGMNTLSKNKTKVNGRATVNLYFFFFFVFTSAKEIDNWEGSQLEKGKLVFWNTGKKP